MDGGGQSCALTVYVVVSERKLLTRSRELAVRKGRIYSAEWGETLERNVGVGGAGACRGGMKKGWADYSIDIMGAKEGGE